MTKEVASVVKIDLPTPDFGWPYRVTEFIFDWLSNLWGNLRERLQAELLERRFLGSISRGLIWSSIAYLGIIWACACYVEFPVSPYGLWEVVGWIIFAGALIGGAISLCLGVATIAIFLRLLLLIGISLTLSLAYLCWVLWNAQQKQSLWLQRYCPIILTGIITVLTLATFVDGSYRFWDRPFGLVAWGKLVFIGASAWAALFCHLARDKVLQPATPRRILKWTLGLTIGIGVFVYWQAGGQRTEYFLNKSVIEHPNDEKAWLDLAWYYSDEGDRLANDPGDDEHSPPDPSPYYNKALSCFDRAVKLGAAGFDVNYERAVLADAVGKEQAAVEYGQEALRFASSNTSTTDDDDAVKWLHKMIARNAIAPIEVEHEEDRKRLVRESRQDYLPGIVRWVFEVLEE